MQAKFETLSPKTLIGQQMSMSLSQNRTGGLFRAFMPRRTEITQTKDLLVYDLRIYPPGYFQSFSPSAEFVKWALVEVEPGTAVPAGMELFQLEGGRYAVFTPNTGANDPEIFQYIFAEWLPNADFQLDDRPHFERLDPKGKKNNPDAEQEVWIPIIEK